VVPVVELLVLVEAQEQELLDRETTEKELATVAVDPITEAAAAVVPVLPQ
jgi:hypothetical protein